MITKDINIITNQVTDDLIFFSELGLDRDQAIRAVIYVNQNRCKVGTTMGSEAIDLENQKVEKLVLALLDFDRDPEGQ